MIHAAFIVGQTLTIFGFLRVTSHFKHLSRSSRGGCASINKGNFVKVQFILMPGSAVTSARQGLSFDTSARSGEDDDLIRPFLTKFPVMYLYSNRILLPNVTKFSI